MCVDRSTDDSRLLRHTLLVSVLAFLALGIAATAIAGLEQEGYYIAYLGDRLGDEESAVQRQINLLSTVKGSVVAARGSIVHSYTKNFDAFAAKLSVDEADALQSVQGVVSVIPNRYRELHTTKSWDFLGFPQTAARKLNIESNIVIGVLDTGISPKSRSFRDEGLSSPPKKWRGTCGPFPGSNFTCNNKIIGARFFNLRGVEDPGDIQSPIDINGHGTHTASTAGGGVVANASLLGLAKGVARSAVPGVRLAAYKVCWESSGCSDMDVLAGFDAAISDGVDIISISIAGGSLSYVTEPISIGSFHAMKNGIITVASAGNSGPNLGTVVNHAPWILTVAASGIDRQFRSTIALGNGKTTSGIGVSTFNESLVKKMYPLVRGADIPMKSVSKDEARQCLEETLDPVRVRGKIVYCEMGDREANFVVKKLGGIGTILESTRNLDTASIYIAPATAVGDVVSVSIDRYINSTKSPSAAIYNTKEVKIRAPMVASFSSRGPTPGSERIMKPDITAPGINILAGFTPMRTITGLKGDPRHSEYTLMSGTSMACPHVASVAAYLRSFHPDWSPAAIQSAIITSARGMSAKFHPEAGLAFGAGQVWPLKAVSPGLIYDMDELSYVQFLCREGYTDKSLRVLVGSQPIKCSALLPGASYDGLNYPSMMVRMPKDRQGTSAVFLRRVTNVGPAASVYNATVTAPAGVEITVNPASLTFTRGSQTKSFTVVLKAKPTEKYLPRSGWLVWRSSSHVVRSPIVIWGTR